MCDNPHGNFEARKEKGAPETIKLIHFGYNSILSILHPCSQIRGAKNVTRASESVYNSTNDIRKGGQKKKIKIEKHISHRDKK